MPTVASQQRTIDDLFQQSLTASGQIRFLSIVSYLLALFMAYQAQFFTVSSFAWLGFHHISSPLTIAVTFLRRGALVARVALYAALIADIVLFITSTIAVTRCLDPKQAAEDCPNRLVQNGWMALYSANQLVVCLFELLTVENFERFVEHRDTATRTMMVNENIINADKAKRLATDAEDTCTQRISGVERRISIFALVPGVAVWVFGTPFQAGWLAAAAATRPLRDAFAIWSSFRVRDGTNTEREFFNTATTVLSGVYVALSLAAWMWSEQFRLPIESFSAEILIDAAKSAYNDPLSFMVASVDTPVHTEPFLLCFAFLEVLVLCNKNTAE